MQFPRPHMPYSFIGWQTEIIKRNNQFLIIILYRLQRSILTAHRLFIYQHVGGLQIYRTVTFPSDEVHLFFFSTSGIDIIARPKQLQIDKILQFITHTIGCSGIEEILKGKVVDLIFRRTGQYFLSAQVEAFTTIRQERVFNIAYVGSHGIIARLPALDLEIVYDVADGH